MSKQVGVDTRGEEAIRQRGLDNLRPVVEKELLHYDILFCLSETAAVSRMLTKANRAASNYPCRPASKLKTIKDKVERIFNGLPV